MKRLILILTFLMIFVRLFSDENVFLQINALRERSGLKELKQDSILRLTAIGYAEALLTRNHLSHRDPIEKTALDRVRAHGGTNTIVGEIIGSGPDLDQVLSAWEESSRHLEVILKPSWTHMGAGLASGSDRRIWVILFTIKRVESLRLLKDRGGYILSGNFIPDEVEQPILLSGISRIKPLAWQNQSRSFLYHIPDSAAMLYHRLGYISKEGLVKITDVFYPDRLATFFPEREPR